MNSSINPLKNRVENYITIIPFALFTFFTYTKYLVLKRREETCLRIRELCLRYVLIMGDIKIQELATVTNFCSLLLMGIVDYQKKI